MKQITIRFGLIAGAIVLLYSIIVVFAFGDIAQLNAGQLQMVEAFGFLRYLILLLAIVFAIRAYKRTAQTPPTYWSLVKQGVLVSLVVAGCIGIMECVYIALNPDFYEDFAAMYIKHLQENGASASELAEVSGQMESYRWMQNPFMTGVFYFFETLLIGTVMALITARFSRSSIRRKKS